MFCRGKILAEPSLSLPETLRDLHPPLRTIKTHRIYSLKCIPEWLKPNRLNPLKAMSLKFYADLLCGNDREALCPYRKIDIDANSVET